MATRKKAVTDEKDLNDVATGGSSSDGISEPSTDGDNPSAQVSENQAPETTGNQLGNPDPNMDDSKTLESGTSTPDQSPEQKTTSNETVADQTPSTQQPSSNLKKISEPEPVILDHLDLEITNHGDETTCYVANQKLPSGEKVIIRYKSKCQKLLAMRNFAQLNALKGTTRFEFDEG